MAFKENSRYRYQLTAGQLREIKRATWLAGIPPVAPDSFRLPQAGNPL